MLSNPKDTKSVRDENGQNGVKSDSSFWSNVEVILGSLVSSRRNQPGAKILQNRDLHSRLPPCQVSVTLSCTTRFSSNP